MDASAFFLVISGILYGMVRGAGLVAVKKDIACAAMLLSIAAGSYLYNGRNPLPDLGAAVASVAAGYLIFLLLLKRPNDSNATAQ